MHPIILLSTIFFVSDAVWLVTSTNATQRMISPGVREVLWLSVQGTPARDGSELPGVAAKGRPCQESHTEKLELGADQECQLRVRRSPLHMNVA